MQNEHQPVESPVAPTSNEPIQPSVPAYPEPVLGTPAPPKKSKKGLLIAAVIIGVLILGTGAYYLFGRSDTKDAPSSSTPAATTNKQAAAPATDASLEKIEAAAKKLNPVSPTTTADDFFNKINAGVSIWIKPAELHLGYSGVVGTDTFRALQNVLEDNGLTKDTSQPYHIISDNSSTEQYKGKTVSCNIDAAKTTARLSCITNASLEAVKAKVDPILAAAGEQPLSKQDGKAGSSEMTVTKSSDGSVYGAELTLSGRSVFLVDEGKGWVLVKNFAWKSPSDFGIDCSLLGNAEYKGTLTYLAGSDCDK